MADNVGEVPLALFAWDMHRCMTSMAAAICDSVGRVSARELVSSLLVDLVVLVLLLLEVRRVDGSALWERVDSEDEQRKVRDLAIW